MTCFQIKGGWFERKMSYSLFVRSERFVEHGLIDLPPPRPGELDRSASLSPGDRAGTEALISKRNFATSGQ